MLTLAMKTQRCDATPGFPFRLLAATYGIADSRTAPITRRDYEVCTVEYIYKGKGYLETNGHSCTPGKGSVYFLHKHSNHRYWPDKRTPWAKLFFVVDGELMESLLRAYGFADVHYLPDCPQLKTYFDAMIRFQPDAGDVHRQAALLFHSLLEECRGILTGGPGRSIGPDLQALKQFLDNGTGRKVCLKDYCNRHGLSCASMIRRFHRRFGASPYDYLMRKRLNEARMMLRHSALSVKEIASRLKFSDQYYFSNYFKRKTGMAPLNYRQSGRKPEEGRSR